MTKAYSIKQGHTCGITKKGTNINFPSKFPNFRAFGMLNPPEYHT